MKSGGYEDHTCPVLLVIVTTLIGWEANFFKAQLVMG